MEFNKNNDLEIDYLGLISKLLKKRKFIILCCLIGSVIGLVAGFSIPKTYQAKVSFAPEIEQKFGSGVSSIASMMGVNVQNSVDAISVEMFPDVISSTPFLFDLFSMQVETVDGLQTDLYDYMLNHQKAPWWVPILNSPFRLLAKLTAPKELPQQTEVERNVRTLSKLERDVYKGFLTCVSIEMNKKTGKTEISVIMQDKQVAAMVLDQIVENLKAYMINYRTSKDRQDVLNLERICEQRKLEYYEAQSAYAQYADSHRGLVLQSAQAEQLKLQQEMNLAYQVYSQVATQLEGARIKEQHAKPVFVVIEPVTIPYKKHSPSKAKLLIAFTFLGGLFSSLWVLWLKDLIKKIKSLF